MLPSREENLKKQNSRNKKRFSAAGNEDTHPIKPLRWEGGSRGQRRRRTERRNRDGGRRRGKGDSSSSSSSSPQSPPSGNTGSVSREDRELGFSAAIF